jgi:hypothetical protein
MEKKNWQFLLISISALATLFLLPLILHPALALIFKGEGNERYTIQINNLSGMSIKVVLFLTEKYKCDFVNRVFCVHIRA